MVDSGWAWMNTNKMFDYRRCTEDWRVLTETLERDATNDVSEFQQKPKKEQSGKDAWKGLTP